MRKLFTTASRNWLLATFVFALAHTNSFAQSSSQKILSDISENEIALTGQRYTFPKHYRTLHLNKQNAQQFFGSAPVESATSMKSSQTIFEMPMPDGSTSHFRIWETPVMSPDLAAQFPDIKTYAGQGIDEPNASIRLDMTPLGFHAMVLSPNGSAWIDPYCLNTTDDYICYFKRELPSSVNFICGTESLSRSNDDYHNIIPPDLYTQRVAGAQLRTYRLALACTGEYAATKGGTVAGAMAGIVTSINRVDGVYETEVAIRMTLIANNSSIVYTNSSTDPYTNSNGSTMLGQNQTTCTNVIGSANYDIGHVFSTGGGGVALLGCVCSSSTKAEGVTGSSNPVGDAYDIDYVAHEMGHQFGGNHTFNSTSGSCGGGNRASSAAYETGSGITIMAYAGICSPDDLAAHSIAYFHSYSFDEIVTYTTTGTGNTCPVTTTSGNNPPNVTSQGANYTIPISTPFVLTGAATDADGDPLTYSWEEMDLGTAGGLNVQSTTAPQFCPFSPVTSPSRTFPQLSSIINNTTSVGEWLPNQARSLKFRLTARDNKMGGGGVMHPDVNVTLTVANTGGAFTVTAPNTAVTWAGGSTQAVTWSVNGTSGSPINCANVMISLSTDGGNTFPTVLLASTVNDGTENITVPNIATTTARIKVEAVGNIFFDMSNVNFTITAASGLTAISTSTISPIAYCAGASVNVAYTTTGSANTGNIFTAQLSNSAGSFASPVAIGTLTSTTAGTIAATIPAGTATGSGYRIRVVSSSPVVTGSDNGANISISAQVAAAGSISTAFTSFCANIPITFNTSAIANATTYTWAATGGAVISSGQGTLSAVIVFPNTITTSTVSFFGSNANCTGASSTLVVTIMATPNAPTANNATGCSGTPITLTGSPAGGTFSVPNPYNGSSTTFTYNVANGNGCNTTSSPANITVNTSPTVSISGTSTICNGSSTTLTASGASTFLWTGGPATAAYNVSPSTNTTFTVTGTAANGCTGTASILVSVNPLPTVTANNVSGCSGSSIALSGSPAGGTWSVANPYSGSSTTYTHTYTDVNGCTNTSSSASITVNPLPTVTANNVSGCAGSSIALLGTPAGGTWSVANPYSGSSTTYTHTYTDVNGCTNTSSSASITVNPLPTVTADNVSGCSGSSIALSGTPAGGTWGVANPYTGSSTTYTHTYTDVNGCTNTSSSASITVNPLPTVTANNVSGCAGSSIALSGTPAGGTWSVANPYSGSSTTYTHTYTDVNGCTNTSSSANITANPLPTVSFSGLSSSYYVSAASVTLTGSPSGGTFSGTGISGNTFSPSSAGVGGPYTITYSYTDVNGCSNSSSQQTTVTSCAAPAQPGTISVSGGSAKVCPGDARTYSVTAVSGATVYNWSAPTGANITSGAGSNIISITFDNTFIASGTLSVTAGSSCGTSIARTLTISRNTLSTPSVITGLASGVCAGTSGTYSVTSVAGATYNWTAPTNATISSGQGTNLVVVNFSALFTSGTLSVTANNACGASSARTLSILSKPATPGTISGASVGVCAGTSGTYSVTNVVGVTYNWTAPANASITSGQGTNSVAVDFSGLFISGSLSVTGSNSCGASAARTLSIASVPATPGTISGSAYGNCNATNTYTIVAVANATSYTWSCNVAGSIVTPAGTSATISFPAFTSGTVSVTANNACGSSALRTLSVKGTPATPASISGSATACANQSGVPYSISSIATATNYTWTVPTGATIFDGAVTSSGTSLVTTATSVSVNFGSTTGNVSAKANNACGSGSTKSLAVTFNCRELNNGSDFDFTISPNPASEFADVIFLSQSESKYTIRVMDVMGKTILLNTGNSVVGENHHNIQTGFIAKGVYLLEVVNGDERALNRIVID